MAQVAIATVKGDMPAYVAVPGGAGPWPGVVVVHDAFGMSGDLRNQADWLASRGFIAVAPDLYFWGRLIRCVIAFVRDAARALGEIDAARDWLVAQPSCTGRVGVIGYCMGGGFAMMLAPRHGYAASSVNYGGLTRATAAELAASCPLVASYGGRDRILAKVPARLERALSEAGVDHDVKVYPQAGHGFINDHSKDGLNAMFVLLGWMSGTAYDESAADDARRRIAAFFDRHLRDG